MELLDNQLVKAGLGAIVIFTVVMGIFAMLNRNKSDVSQRLRRLTPQKEVDESDPEAMLMQDEEKSDLADNLERLMKGFGVNFTQYEDELHMKFMQAGVSSPNATAYYVFMKYMGIPIAIVISALLLRGSPSSGAMLWANLLFCLILLYLGYKGADLYLRNRKEKRQKNLVRSFPEALDLILICVESGLALDAALSRVCKELGHAHPDITEELNRTRIELTVLNDRGKALQNLAERTDLMQFKALTSTLLQSERFGTSLTETLRVLSDDYRQTRLMVAENKAGKLPALMTIPLMLLMMPAFVMILLGPAIISFAEVWSQK